MKVSLIKDAIDKHHAKMSEDLYQPVWEPVSDLQPTSSYLDVVVSYFQALNYLSSWFLKVAMLKTLAYAGKEPAPVEWLKGFYHSLLDKHDEFEMPRDLTPSELCALYAEFYHNDYADVPPGEFRFFELRDALDEELGGPKTIAVLRELHLAGTLNVKKFTDVYLNRNKQSNNAPAFSTPFIQRELGNSLSSDVENHSEAEEDSKYEPPMNFSAADYYHNIAHQPEHDTALGMEDDVPENSYSLLMPK